MLDLDVDVYRVKSQSFPWSPSATLVFNLLSVASPRPSCSPPQGSGVTLWCVWCDGNPFSTAAWLSGGRGMGRGASTPRQPLFFWTLRRLRWRLRCGLTGEPPPLQQEQQKLGKPPSPGTSQTQWHQQEIKINQYRLGEGEDDEIAFLSPVISFLYQENKIKFARTEDSLGVSRLLCTACHMVPLRSCSRVMYTAKI